MVEKTIGEKPDRRKVLSLAIPAKEQESTENHDKKPQPNDWRFVAKDQAVYMVWCEGGDMPTRVYAADEYGVATFHAKNLSVEHGKRFHVLRSWRISKPPT